MAKTLKIVSYINIIKMFIWEKLLHQRFCLYLVNIILSYDDNRKNIIARIFYPNIISDKINYYIEYEMFNNYIYLDTMERLRFANTDHEYLFEQYF